MHDDIILLSHGAGGLKSAELMQKVFLPAFSNTTLQQLGDAAILDAGAERVAFTTDSFVINPIIFPGGDIGKLAVCGTINDLTAAGARPIALATAFILEEGLEIATLQQLVDSMGRTAREIGVPIVAGDTKVVPRGAADKLFITTSGIGILPTGRPLPAPHRAALGDAILVSGTLADHGMAVMIVREGLQFTSQIHSDCAPLYDMIAQLQTATPDIHCLRDPTRGGLAAVLNELALASGVCMEIDEESIPIRPDVNVACELLGIDPLHVANEGKMVIIVPQEDADRALASLRTHPLGGDAARIGQVIAAPAGRVHLITPLGSRRILDLPAGDLLPRIC